MTLMQAPSRCTSLVLSRRGVSLPRVLRFCSKEVRCSKHRAAFSALAATERRLHVGAGCVSQKVPVSGRHELQASVRVVIPRGSPLSTSAGPSPHADGDDQDGQHDFHDPRLAILDAALEHVHQHGFSTTALAAGARDCGFHSVATGMFPGGEADLIHHLMAKALDRVKAMSKEGTDGTGEAGGDDAAASRAAPDHPEDEHWEAGDDPAVAKLKSGIKAALLTIEPYREHWPKAMATGALPQNAGATATALAVLADELAFLSGDRSTDLNWYGKRGLIAGIYGSTELFMLTDDSEGMKDTWGFLDRRIEDYETLCSTPESVGDIVTGVGTVAASFSSAVLSLGGPFLQQASKQVPGGESLATLAPTAAALGSQALSILATRLPYGKSGADSGTNEDASEVGAPRGGEEGTPKFPGAPEEDPWNGPRGVTTSTPEERTSDPRKFEQELRAQEEELFGSDSPKGKSGPDSVN